MTIASQTLNSALTGWLGAARQLRQVIHADPRLSGDETATARAVLGALPPDLDVTPVAGTGAVVRIGPQGDAVAVRAELDALAIDEQTGAPWAATNTAMHACGHDVHIAAAVALARAVATVPDSTPLVLLLQPREETTPSGALDIVEGGILTDHRVGAVIGAHVQPLLETGSVSCTPGVVNASADEFVVTMRGQGGHAAYPHLGADAVHAMSLFVVALQQLVARETDPMSAAVVSVGAIRAGASPNVRPDHATATGTVRAMSAEHRGLLLKRLESTAHGVATACGCETTVAVSSGEPVLSNNANLAGRAQTHLTELGLTRSGDLRSCGSDDFAYYGTCAPALMMFVGTGLESGKLHSATFLPADDAVDHTARALLAGYLAACDLIHDSAPSS